jgi:hypothetical protein
MNDDDTLDIEEDDEDWVCAAYDPNQELATG